MQTESEALWGTAEDEDSEDSDAVAGPSKGKRRVLLDDEDSM